VRDMICARATMCTAVCFMGVSREASANIGWICASSSCRALYPFEHLPCRRYVGMISLFRIPFVYVFVEVIGLSLLVASLHLLRNYAEELIHAICNHPDYL
jgi:hypothetical protein